MENSSQRWKAFKCIFEQKYYPLLKLFKDKQAFPLVFFRNFCKKYCKKTFVELKPQPNNNLRPNKGQTKESFLKKPFPRERFHIGKLKEA